MRCDRRNEALTRRIGRSVRRDAAMLGNRRRRCPGGTGWMPGSCGTGSDDHPGPVSRWATHQRVGGPEPLLQALFTHQHHRMRGPGWKAKNLPISVLACDGNTIQGNTILVQPNGSFFEHGYQVYALPNASQLGESPDSLPVCNGKQLRALHRAEPGEVQRTQDLVPSVHDLEVEQTFMKSCGAVLQRSIAWASSSSRSLRRWRPRLASCKLWVRAPPSDR